MKTKFFNSLKLLWQHANSNVGSALIGATAAYVLTKGSGEEEIKRTQKKLENSEIRLIELEVRLKQADERVFNLLQSKIDTASELQHCLRQKVALRYAYDNSSCFFRHHYSEELSNSNNLVEQNNPKQKG